MNIALIINVISATINFILLIICISSKHYKCCIICLIFIYMSVYSIYSITIENIKTQEELERLIEKNL